MFKILQGILTNLRIKSRSSAGCTEVGHLRPSAPASVPSQAELDARPPYSHSILHMLLHSCFFTLYWTFTATPCRLCSSRTLGCKDCSSSPGWHPLSAASLSYSQASEYTMLAMETARYTFLLSDLLSFFFLNKRKEFFYLLLILNIFSLEMFFSDMYVSYMWITRHFFPSLFIIGLLPFS